MTRLKRSLCAALMLMTAVCLTAYGNGSRIVSRDGAADLLETEGRDDPEKDEFLIYIPKLSLTDKEAVILQKIALAEAEDHGVNGMALVMDVVMNRVRSGEWPDTIGGVVFQKGQFSSVEDGRYERMRPNPESRRALDLIESGWDGSQGAEYFCNERANAWHERNLKRLFKYRTHVFYR